MILITAYGSIEEAVTAMKEGAFDFIQKPVDLEHLKLLRGPRGSSAGIAARKSAAARGICRRGTVSRESSASILRMKEATQSGPTCGRD